MQGGPRRCHHQHVIIWHFAVQKREAKACLEAAGKMLKVHAAGRIPLNRKEDEIYKVNKYPVPTTKANPASILSQMVLDISCIHQVGELTKISGHSRLGDMQCDTPQNLMKYCVRRGWWQPMRPGWRTPSGRAQASGQP